LMSTWRQFAINLLTRYVTQGVPLLENVLYY